MTGSLFLGTDFCFYDKTCQHSFIAVKKENLKYLFQCGLCSILFLHLPRNTEVIMGILHTVLHIRLVLLKNLYLCR